MLLMNQIIGRFQGEIPIRSKIPTWEVMPSRIRRLNNSQLGTNILRKPTPKSVPVLITIFSVINDRELAFMNWHRSITNIHKRTYPRNPMVFPKSGACPISDYPSQIRLNILPNICHGSPNVGTIASGLNL